LGDNPGPTLSHERVLWDFQAQAGLAFGLTLSAVKPLEHPKDIGPDGAPLAAARPQNNSTPGNPANRDELVHVVGPKGVNIEYNCARIPTKHGQLVEVQGPGLSLSVDRKAQPDVRLVGIALTGELPIPDDSTRLSYTAEVKVTLHTLTQLLGLFGSKVGRALGATAEALGPLGRAVAFCGRGLAFLTPLFAAAFAVIGIRKAIRAVRSTTTSVASKCLAVANAVFDVVFIFNPVAGALGNAGVATIRIANDLKKKNHRLGAAKPHPKAPKRL
jgi:hypothetical protein